MNGKLVIIVGPSGSGKSSVLKELKKLKPEYVYPLSATTRPMREGEKDGEIYHFYTRERFEEGIKGGEFLEYALVHQDNYYGLIKEPVMDALKGGRTVVREVDIQGFDSIREHMANEDLLTIFITAPSTQELVDRIINRAAISEDELKKRRASMKQEIMRSRDCDYLVENKDGELAQTTQKVIDIIAQETQNT